MSMQKSGSPSSWLASTDGIAAQWQDLLLLLARILFGWTFVMSGWGKLMNISGFVATMPRRGLPDVLGRVLKGLMIASSGLARKPWKNSVSEPQNERMVSYVSSQD